MPARRLHPLPDIERLKGEISYCPETGLFTYRDGTRLAGRSALASPCGGYLRGSFQGQPVYAHRAAWALTHGYWPTIIDHINGCKSDNRLANLREVTALENARNAAMARDNSSGITGVTRYSNRWCAYISDGQRQIRLGWFDRKSDAIRARRKAEKEYGYSEFHGRPRLASRSPSTPAEGAVS